MKSGDHRRRLYSIAILASTTVLTLSVLVSNPAAAQQKVGAGAGIESFIHDYYSSNFINVGEMARGVTGLATASGAGAVTTNPSKLVVGRKWEFLLETAFFRNQQQQEFGTVYDQPDAKVTQFAVAARLSRNIGCGVAFSRPRAIHARLDLVGIPGGAFAQSELRARQLTAGIGVEISRFLRVGFAVELHEWRVSSDLRMLYFGNDHTSGKVLVPAARAGFTAQHRTLRVGATLRSGHSFYLASEGSGYPRKFRYQTHMPWEVGVGLSYRDLGVIEYSALLSSGEKDVHRAGGGVRLPLWRANRVGDLFGALGVRFRSVPELFDNGERWQTLLTSGIEFRHGETSISVTVVNGHWLNSDDIEVSEVLLSLRTGII